MRGSANWLADYLVLYDHKTDRVISLIDLDTVKPGLFLHDLGDALRSCCNPAGQTPGEEYQAFFAPGLLQAWLQGSYARAGFLLPG